MKWGHPWMRTETDNITWGFKQVRILETPRYFKVAFLSLLNYMTVWVKSHTGTQHQLFSPACFMVFPRASRLQR